MINEDKLKVATALMREAIKEAPVEKLAAIAIIENGVSPSYALSIARSIKEHVNNFRLVPKEQ